MTLPTSRPNIVLFLTDDHAPWSLSSYGNTELKTPAFSKLSEAGTQFSHAFTPCPVCSPARACLITGRTPSQVGIHDWLQESDPSIANRDWLAEEITLPELLQRSGYACYLSGKWHLGMSHKTPRGISRYFGLPGMQGGHNEAYTYCLDDELVTLTGNKSTFITDHALSFLDDAASDTPFFLTIGYIATHSPYEAAAHRADLVDEVRSLAFRDIPADPPHPWRRNEGLDRQSEMNAEALRSRHQGYYAAVLEIDRQVERVVRYLENRRLLENTIVIYTSDHGCALGHHGFWGKGNSTRPLNMYDVSSRVPLIVRGPGIPANRVSDDLVDHYDLFRAICEWGKVSLSADEEHDRCYPGTSLAPLAAGRASADRNPARYGEYGDLRSIRTPHAKFVKRYPDGPNDFFHLDDDPDERINLAERPETQKEAAQLESRLEAWYAKHESTAKSGLRVKALPRHNLVAEAWRDGVRESRGHQVYQGIGGEIG